MAGFISLMKPWQKVHLSTDMRINLGTNGMTKEHS